MDGFFSIIGLALAGTALLMAGLLFGKGARQSLTEALAASLGWGTGYFLLLGAQVLALTQL